MIDDTGMHRLEARLGGLLDDGAVSRDAQTRDYLAQDVFTRDKPAGLVLRPANVEQLAAAVAEATSAGCAVIPRGGGMSYSGGYVPAEADSVLLDLRGMNRVLEINRDDMHVSVEAGTSWRELREALAGTGLRTPYWGTLSGIYASVGGSLSQNSIFWGSGHYGSAAESALSLQIVLADGTVLDTGSAGRGNAGPFFRQHGPDLTGLFCGDCGALGIKAAATLRLVPEVEGRAFGAFAFDDYPAMLAAMAEISRQDLAMECFGFDPFLQAQRLRRESLAADAKNLLGVMKSAGGVGKALRDGARIAAAGRGFMEDVAWSFNVMIEDRGAEGAAERLEAARRIAAGEGGRELPDTIPKILRANPFGPVNSMIGPEGERWVPVHGIFPHSQAIDAMSAVSDLFASREQTLAEHGIGVGYLLATISTHCTVLEPVFFWPDALEEIHRRSIEPAHLRKIRGFPENPAARAAVVEIRQNLIALFAELGAAHLQLGKSYPYLEGLQSPNRSLIEALKKKLDPNRRMNPGALGL